MTESEIAHPRFNAFTDAWLPLLQEDGTTQWASPIEVLCGEKDGVDLDYPRDDFRVYARLLLSALVQALFPAKTKAELIARLDQPLLRKTVEDRVRPVLEDFDLFGPAPFLQITPPPEPHAKGAAPFVFPGEDLYQSRVPIDAISIPIALVMLFIEQTYAGGAGRGYGAGPARQPGALTLIDAGSVRGAAWANTMTLENVEQKYAHDDERPWSNKEREARPRASIGIVGGLFFQPRSIWLVPAGEGECSFTGCRGPLVRRSPFGPKSKLSTRTSSSEDLWQHPCAPLAVNSQGIGAIRLNAERPAWTGLAQLLNPISKVKGATQHPREGPAPVLQQWKTLKTKTKRPRLLVLDFVRDKANVKRRFFEAFPLTDQLLGNPNTVERLRALIDDAQSVRLLLVKALTRAHDDRKQGGLALADAETSYWTASEAPFLDWLAAVTATATGEVESRVDQARQSTQTALRRTALAIFDAHVAISEFDPRKQELVAKARRTLINALYPRARTAATTPPSAEVTP
ncbi:MAG TPA: type I-E CRISPR-associated protein Cse1/CasA [Candidatus Krumholzibacteria bacterium]